MRNYPWPALEESGRVRLYCSSIGFNHRPSFQSRVPRAPGCCFCLHSHPHPYSSRSKSQAEMVRLDNARLGSARPDAIHRNLTVIVILIVTLFLVDIVTHRRNPPSCGPPSGPRQQNSTTKLPIRALVTGITGIRRRGRTPRRMARAGVSD